VLVCLGIHLRTALPAAAFSSLSSLSPDIHYEVSYAAYAV